MLGWVLTALGGITASIISIGVAGIGGYIKWPRRLVLPAFKKVWRSLLLMIFADVISAITAGQALAASVYIFLDASSSECISDQKRAMTYFVAGMLAAKGTALIPEKSITRNNSREEESLEEGKRTQNTDELNLFLAGLPFSESFENERVRTLSNMMLPKSDLRINLSWQVKRSRWRSRQTQKLRDRIEENYQKYCEKRLDQVLDAWRSCSPEKRKIRLLKRIQLAREKVSKEAVTIADSTWLMYKDRLQEIDPHWNELEDEIWEILKPQIERLFFTLLYNGANFDFLASVLDVKLDWSE